MTLSNGVFHIIDGRVPHWRFPPTAAQRGETGSTRTHFRLLDRHTKSLLLVLPPQGEQHGATPNYFTVGLG